MLRSVEEMEALVEGFENGTWPVAQWRHWHHLVVATCYILNADQDPMDLLRVRIRHYNECQGGVNSEDSGYHETLTRFWTEVLTKYVDTLPREWSRLEIVNSAIAEFGGKRDLFKEYYSFDVVKSREARAAWIAPNAM